MGALIMVVVNVPGGTGIGGIIGWPGGGGMKNCPGGLPNIGGAPTIGGGG